MNSRAVLPALVAATILTGFASPTLAADVAAKPVFKAAPMADSFDPWMVRFRALGVVTRNSGNVDQVV